MNPEAGYSKEEKGGKDGSPELFEESPRSAATSATSPGIVDSIREHDDGEGDHNQHHHHHHHRDVARDDFDDDDFFGENYTSQDNSSRGNGNKTEEMLSELPQMRRQHVAAGYREGLSVSKAQSMQGGFDDGYPLGVDLGHRVGQILGVLEGYLACRSVKAVPGVSAALNRLYTKARKELIVSELLRGMDDDTLASLSTELPLEVTAVVEWWEGVAYGVLRTWSETIKLLPELDKHDLRHMVEQSRKTGHEKHIIHVDQGSGSDMTAIPKTDLAVAAVTDKVLSPVQQQLTNFTTAPPAPRESEHIKNPKIPSTSAANPISSQSKSSGGENSIGPTEGWNGRRATYW